MSISETIEKQIIEALRAGEKDRLIVLRGLKSDLKYKKIDKGDDLTDAEELAVLSTAAKKIRDSIEQFTAGGRDDLVAHEQFGLKIVETFLPEQMSEEKLREIIQQTIEETGIDSPQKVGLVMKAVMPKLKGKADGKLVSKLAAELLAK